MFDDYKFNHVYKVESVFFQILMEDSAQSDAEPVDDEQLWDDVTQVSFNYIKTGNSNLDGMLTTHDYHFKVQLQLHLHVS